MLLDRASPLTSSLATTKKSTRSKSIGPNQAIVTTRAQLSAAQSLCLKTSELLQTRLSRLEPVWSDGTMGTLAAALIARSIRPRTVL